jgi:predicted AAA+ superfamily ATPase
VQDINSTALLKDVVIRHQIRQPQLLDKLVAFLYDNVGNLISIRSIVSYLKNQGRGTDPETIANYIKYLEDAFIIKTAPRYDIKGKKLLQTNDKFYLGDHSLQYAIRNKRPDKVQGVLENIVFMELVRRGYNVYVGKIEDKEVDFIAEEQDGTRKIYIQVCLEFTTPATYEREFAPLKEIKDNYHKYVVTLDKNWRADEDGIQGIHLKDFLLKDIL